MRARLPADCAEGYREGWATKIYWNTRSGSFAPEAVAAEGGIRLERVRADLRRGGAGAEALRRLNPMAQVPALVLDDGRVITESAAICLFLAELAGGAELLPPPGSGDRAWALRWLMFLACEIYPSDLRESYPDRYADDEAAAASVRRAANARIDRAWAMVEAALGDGPFLLGARFSLVDPYLAMMLAWHREPQALLGRSPKLARLLETTIARPALAPLWREYELDSGL